MKLSSASCVLWLSMRRLACLVLACSAPAQAETRLDVVPIPDLSTLEPVYPLDRDYERDTRRVHLGGSVTLGLGEDSIASGTAMVGLRGERVSGAATSELQAAGSELVRGRHRARLAVQSWGDRRDDHGLRLEVEGAFDHGRSVGLAPLALGTGQRDTARTRAVATYQLTPERNDFVLVAGLEGSAGWSQRIGIDRAVRRGGGMSLGRAPVDGELPRGSIDMVRGRVEHVSISRDLAAAGGAPLGAEVRIVEVGIGPHDFTFHVDREVLAVLDIDLGWSWLEADTATGRLADNMFRAQWAGQLVSTKGGEARRAGIALARQPTHTPDGQRLVSEWRLGVSAGADKRRFVIDTRGGISWASVMTGGPPASTVIRYGSQLEAFAKLGAGFEAGGFHAAWFEPPPGDPYAAPRRWTIEAGFALRWRPRYEPAPYKTCSLRRPIEVIVPPEAELVAPQPEPIRNVRAIDFHNDDGE
jgi:hypothetical protein